MKLLQLATFLTATIMVSACQTTTRPAAAGHDCVVTPYDMVECNLVE